MKGLTFQSGMFSYLIEYSVPRNSLYISYSTLKMYPLHLHFALVVSKNRNYHRRWPKVCDRWNFHHFGKGNEEIKRLRMKAPSFVINS